MACNWEPRLRVTQGKNPVITVGAVVEFHTEIQSAPQIVRNPQNPMRQMANFWRDKQGALRRRINEYCTNGSHKEDFMNETLTEGYELWVRVKTSEGCRRHGEQAVREVPLRLEHPKKRRDPTYTALRKEKFSHA